MRTYEDNSIFSSFQILRHLAREIALEQMGKAGNAVRKGMRSALKAEGTKYLTRVGANGPYLEALTGGRQYGLRESHTQDGQTSNPTSMANMISSFLMEKSSTLVVGGMNPSFRPLLRKDGEVVGAGPSQSAVSPSTAAILARMDTGTEGKDYPTRSKLTDEAEPRGFMPTGIGKAQSSIKSYLSRGFDEASKRAVNNQDIKVIRRELRA